MKKELGGLIASSIFLLAPTAKAEVPRIVPQPSACVIADFSSVRVKPNRQVTLKLTNKCGEAVDMQNVAVSFQSSREINTNFTGNW